MVDHIVKPFSSEHANAEDHVADMLSAYLDSLSAGRAANDVMARLHLSGYDFVKRSDGLRAVRFELWDGTTLVVSVDEEDPGDIGEPRSVSMDNVTYLSARTSGCDECAALATTGQPETRAYGHCADLLRAALTPEATAPTSGIVSAAVGAFTAGAELARSRTADPGGLRAFWNGDESRRVIVQLPPIGPDGRCTRCGSTPSRHTGSCRCHRVVIEQVAAIDDPARHPLDLDAGWVSTPEATAPEHSDATTDFARRTTVRLTPEATAPDTDR
jgi:hypothetical protein